MEIQTPDRNLFKLSRSRVCGNEPSSEVGAAFNCFAERVQLFFLEEYCSTPKFNCKMFEDNAAYISIVDSDKFTPMTKHIALKYHWFKEYAKRKVFDIK